jgi:hypothetical protein
MQRGSHSEVGDGVSQQIDPSRDPPVIQCGMPNEETDSPWEDIRKARLIESRDRVNAHDKPTGLFDQRSL